MRLALVATPAALPDLRPTPGSLDGDMIRSRLPLPDTSFRVVDLDPAVDLAEQLEGVFERGEAGDDPVLFYASCRVILSDEGEIFLSFDPTQPDTGDSLGDIAMVFAEHARGPVAFVVECRHAPDPGDPFRSAAVVGAAKDAIKAAGGAVELLVAANPMDEGDLDDRPSAITRALIEALDDPEAQYGLTLAGFCAAARESADIATAVRCFAHVRGKIPFELLPQVERPRAPAVSEPILPPGRQVTDPGISAGEPPASEPEEETAEARVEEPPAAHDDEATAERAEAAEPEEAAAEDDDETSRMRTERRSVPVPPPPPDAAPVKMPEPRAPFRSEVGSIPILMEEDAREAPPEPRAPFRSEVGSIPVIEVEEMEAAVALRDDPAVPEPRAPFRSVEISVDLSDEIGRAALVPEPPPPEVEEPPEVPEPPPPPKASTAAKPTEGRVDTAAAVLPEERSFRRSEPAPPPRVVFTAPRPSEPAPASKRESEAPPPVSIPEPPAVARISEPPKRTSAPPKSIGPADHIALGDALKSAGDFEAALTSYKRALGMLGGASSPERAEIYVRLGQIKQAQEKRREAVANYEKALALFPTLDGSSPMPASQRTAMESLIDLHVAEGDPRAVAAAEEALLATLFDPDERFWRLVEFGTRWQDESSDAVRARAAFERARTLKPDDTGVLDRLVALYRAAGMAAEALMTGQKLAALTRDPRERAERYFELGKQCLHELRKEELGLELFDLALESDPTMLEPLAVIAKVLGERQEWSQLEQAYRRMLDRFDQMPEGAIRTDVTFELCRRLGLLFRDHLEDPALGLDAFEDAVHAKPTDLPMVLTTADLARQLGKHDRAALHLAEAAFLEPARAATYHDLFEAFQKLRRPDQAFQAACVTMLLRQSDARERFIFEEHKHDGVPKPAYAMPAEGWEWLRPHDRDVHAEAVLAAVTPAAIAVRLSQLAAEGRLPEMDTSLRQDPERSTISIVRSFKWASHFLAVPAPAIYLNDDPNLALASVVTEEPTVFAGVKAQRGRSLAELAFMVGRHLAYHVGAHRLLLYYPSIEDLTVCFLAAIRLVMPEVPAPPNIRAAVSEIERGIDLRISESARVDLAAAVAAFEAAGSRSHLAEWAADVERCATRAGFLLAGDLEVAATMLRSEPRALLEPEEKVGDLCAFAVSEEHHALRESLGIAIQP